MSNTMPAQLKDAAWAVVPKGALAAYLAGNSFHSLRPEAIRKLDTATLLRAYKGSGVKLATTLAKESEDQDFLFHVWKADRRVNVRQGLAGNPRVGEDLLGLVAEAVLAEDNPQRQHDMLDALFGSSCETARGLQVWERWPELFALPSAGQVQQRIPKAAAVGLIEGDFDWHGQSVRAGADLVFTRVFETLGNDSALGARDLVGYLARLNPEADPMLLHAVAHQTYRRFCKEGKVTAADLVAMFEQCQNKFFLLAMIEGNRVNGLVPYEVFERTGCTGQMGRLLRNLASEGVDRGIVKTILSDSTSSVRKLYSLSLGVVEPDAAAQAVEQRSELTALLRERMSPREREYVQGFYRKLLNAAEDREFARLLEILDEGTYASMEFKQLAGFIALTQDMEPQLDRMEELASSIPPRILALFAGAASKAGKGTVGPAVRQAAVSYLLEAATQVKDADIPYLSAARAVVETSNEVDPGQAERASSLMRQMTPGSDEKLSWVKAAALGAVATRGPGRKQALEDLRHVDPKWLLAYADAEELASLLPEVASQIQSSLLSVVKAGKAAADKEGVLVDFIEDISSATASGTDSQVLLPVLRRLLNLLGPQANVAGWEMALHLLPSWSGTVPELASIILESLENKPRD